MGHSQSHKAANRERILDEAARVVREGGLDALSVGGLMRSLGLTHGGFYGHFESLDVLRAEAVARALAQSTVARQGPEGRPPAYGTLVRRYLSRPHRDDPANGCAIAALATDVARADAATRAAVSEQLEAMAAQLGAELGSGAGAEPGAQSGAEADTAQGAGRGGASSAAAPGTAPGAAPDADLSDQRGLFALSAMVGALLVARMMTPGSRSDAVLAAARRELLALQSAPAAVASRSGR